MYVNSHCEKTVGFKTRPHLMRFLCEKCSHEMYIPTIEVKKGNTTCEHCDGWVVPQAMWGEKLVDWP